tara:strand:+ start:43086 stop:44939 length:1854 start_codon:yes stop_codon:yes gene_type:complete
MRIKGILFLLIVAVIAFLTGYFVTDERVESNIEYQASLVNEALVEIDGFRFDLFDLNMGWDRLQVTNPNNTMMNTFETGKTEFDVEFWPLLWQKVIVNNVQLTGFEMDTERETDGYFEIPLDEEGKAEEPSFFAEITKQVTGKVAENARMEFTDIKNDINVDSLLAMVNIQSVDKMDSLKTASQQTYGRWEDTINNNPIEDRTATIKKQAESIDLKAIKTVPQAVEQVKKIQTIVKEADSLKKEIETIKSNFQTDLSQARAGVSNIDNWIQSDIQRAATVAKLPEINAQNIGNALFGNDLLGDFSVYLEYIAIARKYGSRVIGTEEEEDKPERYEGKNYSFSDKYDWPALWIKNVNLSGKTNTDISLAGAVTNISSDQMKTGVPTVFNVSGEDANAISLVVDGEFNYLEEKPRETVKATYAGFSLKNSRLSPSELLPYDLSEGTGQLSATINVLGKRIDSEIRYVANDLEFDFGQAENSGDRIQTLIRRAISGTEKINAAALIDNVDGPLKVKVRSNLDDLFLDALKGTVTEEVNKAKAQIRTKVENEVEAKREEVTEFVDQKEAELRAKYEELEAQVNERLKYIEDKKAELEKKKKELEEEAKNKAADAIKKKIGF